MKFGIASQFLAMALMSSAVAKSTNPGEMGRTNFYSPSNPIWPHGRSQKSRKSNKLRLSHNAKLKRRRAA